MIEDAELRKIFVALMRILLHEVVTDHYGAATQEPALTARVGERIERMTEVHGLPPGLSIKVFTLDMPDRGPGTLEHKTGTDLYVGIEVTRDGKRKSKGFLVQAKWDKPRSAAEEQRLQRQCRKMLSISNDAYVWSYGKEGITVEKAKAFINDEPRADSTFEGGGVRTVSDVFDAVLECTEGDESLGLPDVERPRNALGEMLERASAKRGVAYIIEANGRI